MRITEEREKELERLKETIAEIVTENLRLKKYWKLPGERREIYVI